MLKKIIIFYIFLHLIFSSRITNAQVSLEIILKSKFPDNVQVFFLTTEEKVFTKKNSITMHLIGHEQFETLEFKLPIGKIEKLRLDFGKTQNEFKIKNIKLSYNGNFSYWTYEDIISGFIANSNIAPAYNLDSYSFSTRPYKGRFDPNIVLNKNGKNKLLYDFKTKRTNIIKSNIKIVAKSKHGLSAYFWIVPQALEKEHYYLLPNRSSFCIPNTNKYDTINVVLYTNGYISAFSLDFKNSNSKNLLLKNIEFNDEIRELEWSAEQIDKHFVLNSYIKTDILDGILKLNFKGNEKNVGPRIEYRFNMIRLTNLVNSIKIKIGSVQFYLNFHILTFLFFIIALFLFNKKYMAFTKHL